MRRRATLLIIASVSAGLAGAPATAKALDAPAATATVNQAVQEATDAFAGKTVSREERRRMADRLVQRFADRQQMAAAVLGRYWTRTSAADQTKFQSMIIDYALAFWGDGLSDISKDQKITVTSSEAQGSQILLHSLSTEPGSDPTPIDWLVGTAADGHAVILDLVVEGVSPIKTMRDDFAAVLRTNGGDLGLLMQAMQKKIDGAVASK
ncbi:MAG TPA: ABC transporter substrate-binding protein [Alphaproteobacteria bacterium]